jgi:hypothetical protein
MAFLVANMPRGDLQSLKRDFLLQQVRYAYRARAEVPWGPALPDELFFNGVLPYASVNERRDDWRKDFFDRFLGVAKKCRTPGEAALQLNHVVFEQLDVKYHATRRPKPDQSPYESVAAKYASCTGLSVLVVDACRAVAIPARLVGTPLWTDRSGNHNWAEVWDGQWRYLGAAESTRLDDGWFTAKAAKADAGRLEHRIYATSFLRTKTFFPLVWNLSIRDVAADDVTCFYTQRREATFRLAASSKDKPKARLTVRLDGRIVALGTGEGPFVFKLAGGQNYDVECERLDKPGSVHRNIALPVKGESAFELKL